MRQPTHIRLQCIGAALLCVALLAAPATAQGDPVFGYGLELDVVYGQGQIAPDGDVQMRNLMMDVYSPSDAGAGPWPALVYIHGGAFHRGGRRNPPYKLGGAIHSSPEDWARFLAGNGYKVFVIEYRLAPEVPVTGYEKGEDNTVSDLRTVISEDMMVGFSRARTGLGLGPLVYNDTDLNLIWHAYMAGVEDAALALDYIVENALVLNIDPERIGMGGHSAGAGITTSVAIGLDTSLKAVFPLSSPDTFFDKDYVASRTDLPAIMMHFSQYDDAPLLLTAPALAEMLRKADTPFNLAWIPGFMHFYPLNAPSLADDGTRVALGDRVLQFLDIYLKE